MTTNFDSGGYWHDTDALADGNVLVAETDGQRWHLSWHPPAAMPDGRNEGSSGICVTPEGGIVLVSPDTITWYLPGGRPEGAESREETLRREVHEEACATVVCARLLGYARSCCMEGPETGVVLVRAFWRAEVQLEAWTPQFEMTMRQVVPASEVIHLLHPVFGPVFRRALVEAGVTQRLADPSPRATPITRSGDDA